MIDQRPTWGSVGRYHSVDQIVASRDGKRPVSRTARELAELLHQYDPELRQRVERAFKQWNLIIRDYLRNETALRLSVGDDTRSVPVIVADGLPQPFEAVIEDLLGEAWLLLNRPLIEQTAKGLALIDTRYDQLTNYTPFQPPPATREQVQHAGEYARRLAEFVQKLELLKRIGEIDQDILGAYFFRVPKIELYWMVIGVMAATLGVSAEALTIVVLSHELAHAYSHLGRDIDGGRWDTHSFARTELEIVEGLAQFYTAVVCERLEHRIPAAKEAYTRLLNLQSPPYKAHCGWTEPNEAGGEIVRVTMIQARGRDITKYADFQSILGVHTEQLTGRERRKAGKAAGNGEGKES